MVIEFVAVALFALIAILVVMLLRCIKEQTAPNPRPTPRRDRRPQAQGYDPALWKDLTNLLYGDYAAAQRLVENELRKSPGNSFDWAMGKVIRDLEYDRSR